MSSERTNIVTPRVEVWIKLEGVLSVPLDPPSNWAVGEKLPQADEALALAAGVAGMNGVYVYGDACYTPRGQRAVQRWLTANGLSGPWVSHEQTPPKGAEVINRWPM